jgi:hypothetical protein
MNTALHGVHNLSPGASTAKIPSVEHSVFDRSSHTKSETSRVLIDIAQPNATVPPNTPYQRKVKTEIHQSLRRPTMTIC